MVGLIEALKRGIKHWVPACSNVLASFVLQFGKEFGRALSVARPVRKVVPKRRVAISTSRRRVGNWRIATATKSPKEMTEPFS